MYYANILVFDIAIEFLIAVVLNFLKCTCEKLYYRLIGTVACRGFAESTWWAENLFILLFVSLFFNYYALNVNWNFVNFVIL